MHQQWVPISQVYSLLWIHYKQTNKIFGQLEHGMNTLSPTSTSCMISSDLNKIHSDIHIAAPIGKTLELGESCFVIFQMGNFPLLEQMQKEQLPIAGTVVAALLSIAGTVAKAQLFIAGVILTKRGLFVDVILRHHHKFDVASLRMDGSSWLFPKHHHLI